MTALQKEVDFVSQHDVEVHDLANQIQKNMLDMETGMRGFVITGDEQYLEPYNQANRSWLNNYNKLHSLLKENGNQQRTLDEMKPLIIDWITDFGEAAIQQKKAGDTTALNAQFKNHGEEKMMEQLRTQFTSFLAKEKQSTNERINKLNQNTANLKITLYAIILMVTVITLVTAFYLSRSIVHTIRQVVKTIKSITESKVDLTTRIHVKTKDETRELADAMNDLLNNLEKQSWVQKSITEISLIYQGITDVKELSKGFLMKLAPMLEAVYGVIYLRKTQDSEVFYVKAASYALANDAEMAESFRPGEGVIGQAAVDKRIFLIDRLPEEHFKMITGLGASSPRSLLVAPILYEGRVEAVVEFAALEPFQSKHLTLLDLLQDKFGSAISSVQGRMEVERLLGESQVMTEELQAQSEELQAQSEELQMQQDQLQTTNEFLAVQKQYAEQRALELKKAKDELEEYSRKLQQSSQYKSDFLANMSHELRTPLNSIIILSQMLMESDEDTNLEEVKDSARVINTAGEDLLRLINDILDLSKIEAGKIEILTDEVNVTELPQMLRNMFDPVAAKKNLTFEVMMDSDVPDVISTDGQRLQQILKNLLSNAFKFTEKGSVSVRISLAERGLAIAVRDTGIGIPPDKQQIIFEAFQQVDGTTNRQYGGTGLGLSICREFTHLLGGTLTVDSEPGKGSTFTLYIPSTLEIVESPEPLALEEAAVTVSESELVKQEEAASVEYEGSIFKGKKILLVEDDGRNIFALISALEKKGIIVEVAKNGKEAIGILREGSDFDLVIMDIMMPVMGGYETMQIIRGELGMHKLPIIALTAKAMKGEREKCMEAGASDYIMKPLNINQLFSLMSVWLTEQVDGE
ncbi:ATP-binding protein [Neobacillus mesonae]|uniref:ATP-binding protein n=1 Tax=Neobacillus mesonae TaxID=1193713 RepID=UPI00203A517B|nr:ATP-binding protein [Neobacillus mesonae]MCM3570510.1 ATP-binding protein [Neobacillus mesonae]